jgi:hypothetical protein
MFWFPVVFTLNSLVAYASSAYANQAVSTEGISALYTMTNNAPNDLVAYPVYNETQLGIPKSFYTGGDGGVSRNSTSGGIGSPGLVSGHSIVVSGNVSKLFPRRCGLTPLANDVSVCFSISST